MRNFFSVAAMAALSANTIYAVCDTDAAAEDCSDWPELDQLVVDHSGDYAWTFSNVTTSDSYNLKLFSFTGDADNADITDQNTKGPVLLLAPINQDCDWWLTVEDNTTDSIPKQLFDDGWNVYIGCKRGSKYSLTNNNFDAVDNAEDFWNFNTDTIALNDIPAMVAQIIGENVDADNSCKKVQIVSQCLGS